MIDSKKYAQTPDEDLIANQPLLISIICTWIVKAPASIILQQRSELDPPDT